MSASRRPTRARTTPRSWRPRRSSGKTTQEKSDGAAGPITLTADPADLKGVDFVIEGRLREPGTQAQGVPGDRGHRRAQRMLGFEHLHAADHRSGDRREAPGGLHRDPLLLAGRQDALVEIIKGEKTSDEALARVFDYTLAIGKTRSWSTTAAASSPHASSARSSTRRWRCSVRRRAGQHRAGGSQAGYPAPPLQLSDELNLELMHKIAVATARRRGGVHHEPHPAEAVVEKMIEIGRPSRLSGAGSTSTSTASAPGCGGPEGDL